MRDVHAIAEQARIEHEILKHITNAMQASLDWETRTIGVSRKRSSVQFVAQSLQRHLDASWPSRSATVICRRSPSPIRPGRIRSPGSSKSMSKSAKP